MISYNEALHHVIASIKEPENELVSCHEAVGRYAAENLAGLVDSPSAHVSLKDGYAVSGSDLACASNDKSVTLKITGTVYAGETWKGVVRSGEAVRITSGSPVPQGADAVVAEEFTLVQGDRLIANATADPGRNILPQGSDVKKGTPVAIKGEQLTPERIGHLAAAGYDRLPVYVLPHVALIATGDEVVAPGNPLQPGQLYASNLVTLAGWCRVVGCSVSAAVVDDDRDKLVESSVNALAHADMVITSGGAWTGEKDLIVSVFDELGWNKKFHRVKMGPGKAVAFGMFGDTPVFCLPGGPPSNHMAFLQLALPCLGLVMGRSEQFFEKVPACLMNDITGQGDWTQFIYGNLSIGSEGYQFFPVHDSSRLLGMARSNGIAVIPEKCTGHKSGEYILVQKIR